MYAEVTKSTNKYVIAKREALINDEVVRKQSDQFLFLKDHQFSSPSQASDVLLGRSSNGWIEWKNKEGKTLDQIKRKEL